jgi:carbon storage regulator
MLVLSRKPGEKIVIGNDITVTVVAVINNRVKLALDAPKQVPILRGELVGWQQPDPDLVGKPAEWEFELTEPDRAAHR